MKILHRILHSLKWRYYDRVQPINAFRGCFESFSEAEQNAPKIKPLGYDSAKSDDWYLTKIDQLDLADYPVLFWLNKAIAANSQTSSQTRQTLLELGGHVGEAYYGFSKHNSLPKEFSWHILDVPSVNEAGRRLALEKQDRTLNFQDQLDRTQRYDIVLACGVLQYIEEDFCALIKTLPNLPKHILINTTPVHENKSFTTLQNIGSVYCPYKIYNRDLLLSTLKELGYELKDAWSIERAFSLPKHPDKSFDSYSGFYFQKIALSKNSTLKNSTFKK